MYISLCFADTSNPKIWSSIFMYLVQSYYRLVLFNSYRDIPSSWPSHTLRSYGCNLTKRAQSMIYVMRMNKSHPWFIRLNILLWKTQETPFQSPCYDVTVDAIKASSGMIKYNLLVQGLSYNAFLHIAMWTSWHYRVVILTLGMSTMAFTKWHDLIINWCNAPWSGNLNH
jgi:hypothetical protein